MNEPYRGGTCWHGIYKDTRCFNCEPEATNTTPRPWNAPTMPTDIPTPPVVRKIDRDEQGRRRSRFVAEFLNVAGEPENAHANAILAVEAVNNYDRLRAIEAAARNLSDRRTLDSDGFRVSQKEMKALDRALHPADKEAETSHE